MSEDIRKRLIEAGAAAVGFAKAAPVEDAEWERYMRWLDAGNNAGLDYMGRNLAIRRDPRLLLPGAKTIISLAFPYYPPRIRPESFGYIALYAYGRDYHKAIRSLLKPVLDSLSREFPDSGYRLCTDSAPVLERYWAQKAGIGFRGRNGMLILPGKGSYYFLAEIITTLELQSDTPFDTECDDCGRCLKSCPGAALGQDIDCRRCLSYLSIEHRGEWTQQGAEAMLTPAGRNTISGCDICQRVCPHNSHPEATGIPDFQPRPEILSADFRSLNIGTEADFKKHFAGTALMRTGFAGFSRNLTNFGTQK